MVDTWVDIYKQMGHEPDCVIRLVATAAIQQGAEMELTASITWFKTQAAFDQLSACSNYIDFGETVDKLLRTARRPEPSLREKGLSVINNRCAEVEDGGVILSSQAKEILIECLSALPE